MLYFGVCIQVTLLGSEIQYLCHFAVKKVFNKKYYLEEDSLSFSTELPKLQFFISENEVTSIKPAVSNSFLVAYHPQ
jgi:hypothetical protein